MKNIQKTWVIALSALFCCFLWGSATPSIKTGYELFQIASVDTAAQILFAGIRFALAGILVIFTGSISQKKFLKPSKEAISKVVILSIFQTMLQYFFFYVSLAHTTGVKGSIISSVHVFLSIFISSICFKLEKLNGKKLLGCLIGFIGVTIVNIGGADVEMSFHFMGEGFMFISAFACAFAAVIIKLYGANEDPVMLNGYQFLLGGTVMAVVGYFAGGRIVVDSYQAILLLIYMAFISAGAYTLWSILLKYNPVSKVTIFGFLTPFFGVILSALILGERGAFTMKSMMALILVCIGIVVVNMETKKK